MAGFQGGVKVRGRSVQTPYTPLFIGETSSFHFLDLPDHTPRIPLPPGLIRRGGRVTVEDLLNLTEKVGRGGLAGCAIRAQKGGSRPPVVAVTSAPLFTRELDSLFGFGDRRRQLAVVSVAGLIPKDPDGSTDPTDPQRPNTCLGPNRLKALRNRIHNLIAHELGHLQGLAHCATPGCVMRSVRDAQELDNRGFLACGKCPLLKWWTPWKELFHSPTVLVRTAVEVRMP